MDNALPLTLAAMLLGAAFISDIRTLTIPNWLNAVFLAAGFVYQFSVSGWGGGLEALIGAAAGLFPLLLLYLLKGIGAGDVKFFAAFGAIVGATAVLQVLLYAILYGGLLGLVILLTNRSFGRRLMLGMVSVLVSTSRLQAWETSFASSRSLRFPFMIAVVPGAITAWWLLPV